MAIIKPFRAVRPAKNYVDMVAELPYDVMNREEAKKWVKKINILLSILIELKLT